MLLLIPLKTTSHLDLNTCLSKWVDTSHPRLSSSQIKTDIKRLHSLRADITKTICSNTSHAFAFDKNNNRTLSDLMEYHACLVTCIQQGFPSSGRDAKVNGTIDAQLQFSWRNAFDTDEDESILTEETKSHFTYEKVCVLWNIAALISYKAAAKYEWTSKDELALVKKEYESIVLILQHIRKSLEKTDTKSNAITSDFTNASIDMCQYMCLAQGQICLYEVMKQKLSSSPTTAVYKLIAQIASGTADLYDRALVSSQDSTIKFSESSAVYGAHFKSLSMLFKARAEYLQSMVDRQASHHGIEIARLSRCRDMMREAIDFTKSNGQKCLKIAVGPATLGKTSLEVQKSLRDTVKQRLNVLTKENASIYHEKIPPYDSLEKITAKDMMSSQIDNCSGESSELPQQSLPESLERPMFVGI